MNRLFGTSVSTEDRRRWLALAVVCLAQLMIVLDSTARVLGVVPSLQSGSDGADGGHLRLP